VGRAYSTNEEEQECIYDIGGNASRRPLERLRRRWVDNIKMDLKRDGMVWYGLD
jgi:hypothetical protein